MDENEIIQPSEPPCPDQGGQGTRRNCLIACSAAAFLLLLLLWIVPLLLVGRVKTRAVAYLEAKLGGEVVFKDFNVSLVRGSFLINELAVQGGSSSEPLLSASRLAGDVSMLSLLSGRLSVTSIHLFNPVLNVEVAADGATNLDKLLSGFKDLPQGPGSQAAKLVITNGTVMVKTRSDSAEPTIHGLEKIDATLLDLGLKSAYFKLNGAVLDRGPSVSGAARFDSAPNNPGDFEIDLELKKMDCEWLAKKLKVNPEGMEHWPRGLLSVRMGIKRNAGDLSLVLDSTESTVTWDGMEVHGVKASAGIKSDSVAVESMEARVGPGMVTGKLDIGRIDGLPVHAELRTSGIPFQRFFPPEAEWAADVATELIVDGELRNPSSLNTLARARIQNARLQFPRIGFGGSDSPLVLCFDDLRGVFDWSGGRLDIRQLNFQGEQGRLEISGYVSDFLDAEGRFDPARLSFELNALGGGDDLASWLGMKDLESAPLSGAYVLSLNLGVEDGEFENLSGHGELDLRAATIFNPYGEPGSESLTLDSGSVVLDIPAGRGAVQITFLEIYGGFFQELKAKGQIGFTGALSLGGTLSFNPVDGHEPAAEFVSGTDASPPILHFTARGTLIDPATTLTPTD